MLFKKAIRDNGWIIVKSVFRYGFTSFTVLPRSLDGKSVKWDIFGPINWKGANWVNESILIKKRRYNIKGYYIPSKGVEAAILLLKDLLQHKKVQRKYYGRIKEYARSDQDSFIYTLIGIFNVNLITVLLKSAQSGKFEVVRNKVNDFRYELIKNSILRNPKKFIKNFFSFIYGHFYDHVKNRQNLFICFIGPDGSGKTTISKKLIESMKDIFDRASYYHGHFGILPELKKYFPRNVVYSIRNKYKIDNKNKVMNKIVYRLIVIYYALGYILGGGLYSVARKKYDLLVFDRYYYDYIIQSNDFTLNSWLFQALLFLIPKPTHVFYLDASAITIQERKKELEIVEIERQKYVCKKIMNSIRNTYVINNERNIIDVVFNIRKILIKELLSKKSS